MAQPPDISETFLREVDENLRRDRARDFLKAYGKWLIAAIILFLAASGGFIWWTQHKQEQSAGQVEQLAQIYKDVGAGNLSKAPQQLDALASSGSKAVRASALFTRAAVAIQQNDLKLATAKYRELATDSSLPQAYRDAALIRQTALEFDQLAPQEVITRLQPLAKPGEPWFGSAGEMTALALIKQGKKPEAGRLFAQIAKEKNAPDSLRARAVQIAGSLGVDVSGPPTRAQ
ncbi:MAG: tetratricopeptide repeat protein [Pseudomonadota bacterium]